MDESTNNQKSGPGFLRQREMEELIDSEGEPITAHLMALANGIVFSRIVRHEKGPIADFDLRYFMEIMQEFAGRHETLTKILAGKGDELNWLPDD